MGPDEMAGGMDEQELRQFKSEILALCRGFLLVREQFPDRAAAFARLTVSKT